MALASHVRGFLPHHVKIMKVALAIAIIRQKPLGESVKDFTQQLSLQFSQLQTDWKTKATQLEAELLRARQELVECQLQTELQRAPPLSSLPSHLTSGSSSSHGDGGSGIIESSQSDSEWQSSGYSSSYQENSQCPDGEESTSIKDRDDGGQLVCGGKGSSTSRDRFEKDNGSCLGSIKDHKEAVDERIRNHMKFFSSVSSLAKIQHHFSSVLHSDLRVTLRDTVLSAIRGLSDAVAGRVCIQEALLENSAENIVATLQFAMMAKFQQELTDACTQLLTVLIGTRLNTAPGQTISNAILCKVIMLLCRLPRLFQFAVGGLTKRISSCAHALSKAMHR